MNNKGFTLIELLAVIVILIGISLTSVLGINSSLERRNIKDKEEQISIAKNAAKIYFSLNSDKSSVNVKTLINEDYLVDSKITKLNICDKISNLGVYTSDATDIC